MRIQRRMFIKEREPWDHIEGTATKPTDDTKMAHWETRLIGSLAL